MRAGGRHNRPGGRGGRRPGRNGRCPSRLGRPPSQGDAALPDRDLALAVALGGGRLARGDGGDAGGQRRRRRRRSPSASTRPASKSIQPGLRAASALFEAIFTVGTGKPSGVPRPVVNRIRVAPAAASAVEETASLPGASSRVRPGGAPARRSAARRRPARGPAFWTAPSDFSSSVVMPPSILPGDGFSETGWPCAEEVALEVVHQRRRCASNTSRVAGARHQQPLGAEHLRDLGEDRRCRRRRSTRSAMRPTSGLAVRPRKAVRAAAFEAEHELAEARPAGAARARRWRRARRPRRGRPRSRPRRPARASVRTRPRSASGNLGEQRGRAGSIRSPGRRAARRRHWDGRRARRASARVPSRSSPSCEQPYGWREGVDAVDRAGVAGMGDGGDPLGGAGDAADRRQDPDLVARADPAVGAAIALEGAWPRRSAAARPARARSDSPRRRSSSGLEIVAVDMVAGRDRLRSAAPIGQPYLRTVGAGGEVARAPPCGRCGIGSRDRRPRRRPLSPGASGRSATATSSPGSSRSRAGGSGRVERLGLRHLETGVRLHARGAARARLAAPVHAV